ncbi:hypothetical protein OIU77_022841 [Salix suchowensis]|uniref:Reverse transcriptase zinc-binding domain-containing protein n=1 Tax=Salix suchowensis TaxID=1278906 RepID=A0ABQ9C1R2_9ROSI|nr:hypothetical protein OIU77_022841 [Salix suchowensis]
MAAFLWRGPSLATSGAKVSWSQLCYPHQEGGLGLKRIGEWNKAATVKHIWRLLTAKNSIWVDWVKAELLRGKCIWQVQATGASSWAWRKILESRKWFCGKFTVNIGNGANTSLWFDHWLPNGSMLYNSCSARVLASTGLPWNASVASIIRNGEWSFPSGHQGISAIWNTIRFKPNNQREDSIVWKGTASGIFSIASAWDFIRCKKDADPYASIIWYPGNVPRFSFIHWLAARGRLATMDLPHVQQLISSSTCVLCGLLPETHNHLFFECEYSRLVWGNISSKINIRSPTLNWNLFMQWAATRFKHKSKCSHYIARQAISTSIYVIWQERNSRVFKNQHKAADTLTMEAINIMRILFLHCHKPIPIALQNEWNL